MKRNIQILALLLSVLLLGGCNTVQKLKNIQVTSATVESISPLGLRGLTGTFLIGLDNPAMQFTVKDISGTVYYKGQEYVDFVADPVTIKGKTTAVYELHATATLRPEVSLMQVLALARGTDLADFTIDINATVVLRSGVGKAISLTGINLKDLLEQ